MEERLKEILAEVSGVQPEEIDYGTRLIADLGLTSFDFADIAARAEEEFNIRISDESVSKIETFNDVLCLVQEGHIECL
ncbi:MAG: acyl carrier protein [Oscillospiraceae bacterium]|nr:acyl carrier protein [Oscillospiraceae bacterium]